MQLVIQIHVQSAYNTKGHDKIWISDKLIIKTGGLHSAIDAIVPIYWHDRVKY